MRAVAYTVRNLASRKLLANSEGSRNNGTVIIQWDDTGAWAGVAVRSPVGQGR